MPGFDPNALHLINGDSAGGTFRQAIANTNRLIIARDVLSCGPLPTFVDMESWTRFRVAFWQEAMQGLPDIDMRLRQTDLSQNVQRIIEASRLYVWAASGNTDQLMVTFLFEVLERYGADPGKVQLVEFLTLPGTERRAIQMGELDATRMRMHPTPRALTMDDWVAYRQAWRAVTADTPAKLLSFERDSPHASAPLKLAVKQVLRLYPDRVSGLPLWDRRLLENVPERGPRAERIIAFTLGERFDEGDLAGDTYLFWRLLRMASPALPKPLLVVLGDTSSLLTTHFELTAFGAEVVAGRASSWPANPIDDWAGGVHLSSAAGNLWFTDAKGGLAPG
ncbi:MAG: hypothetical protein K0Q92_154 [Steroidobacteraceae bacterium]|nr:hypothetical protein [Steroidobacteraceae bacterium]